MQAEINGTELHYVEQGQGRGMLVMHGGLGLEHRYFRPFLDPLAEQVRLVLYDHRSHGQYEQTVDLVLLDVTFYDLSQSLGGKTFAQISTDWAGLTFAQISDRINSIGA